MMIDAFYAEHILGYGYLVDDEGQQVYNPSEDHPMYRRFVESLYCGTLQQVKDELHRYDDLGIEAVFLPSIQRDQIASEIIPEFR